MIDPPNQPLPRFSLVVPRGGGAAGLDAYREAVRDLFRVSVASEADCAIAMEAWHLGPIMVGSLAAAGLSFVRDSRLIASSGVDHFLVQLYVEGRFEAEIDGRPLRVGLGDVVAFDLARPVKAKPPGFRNITLLIPREYIVRNLGDSAALHGLILPASSPLAQLVASYLVSLAERVSTLGRRDADAAARATASLAATVLAHAVPPASPGKAPAASPLRRASSWIAEHIADPHLDAGAVARATGMSRSSLYRSFAPLGGVAAYVRNARLAGAAMALNAPANRRRRLAEIAHDWGFASEGSFARSFKAAFGMTPREARTRSALLWQASPDGDDFATPASFARSVRLLRPAA